MNSRPKSADMSRSNIFRFMKKYGIYSYDALLEKSTEDIEWYWNTVNEDLDLRWFRNYDKVVDTGPLSNIMNSRWFVNGKCNIVDNVIDRNLTSGPGRIAYIFENEDGCVTKVTYEELDKQVNIVAAALKGKVLRRIIKSKINSDLSPHHLATIDNPESITHL